MGLEFWNKCSEKLENKLSQEDYNTWIRPLKGNLNKNTLEIVAPNDFILNYVETNLSDEIMQMIKTQSKKDISLVFKTLTKETFVDKYSNNKKIQNCKMTKNKCSAHPKLRKYGFQIVHFDSPDARGIDVALLYRKSKFFLETVKKYSLYLVDPKTQQRRTSRDQLVLSGYWEGSKRAVSVNHWPSRRGGQKRSQASRLKAAHLQQRILDSIQRHYPEAYLISMGDFNDNPNNKSVSLLTQKSDYRQMKCKRVNLKHHDKS